MWRFFGRVSQFIRTALANSLEALFVSNSNSRSSRTRGIEAPWRSGVRGVFIAEEALRRFEIGTRRLALRTETNYHCVANVKQEATASMNGYSADPWRILKARSQSIARTAC